MLWYEHFRFGLRRSAARGQPRIDSASINYRLIFQILRLQFRSTTETRDQAFAWLDDIADVDDDDIKFEDLLDDETEGVSPTSFSELLAEGFPPHGGLEALAAIARLPDPGKRLAALQRGFLQILHKQRHDS